MSKDVVDAAVVGLDDPIKGHVPFGFIVLQKGIMSMIRSYYFAFNGSNFDWQVMSSFGILSGRLKTCQHVKLIY